MGHRVENKVITQRPNKLNIAHYLIFTTFVDSCGCHVISL